MGTFDLKQGIYKVILNIFLTLITPKKTYIIVQDGSFTFTFGYYLG